MDSEEATERNSSGEDALKWMESRLKHVENQIDSLRAQKGPHTAVAAIASVASALVAIAALSLSFVSFQRADLAAIQLDRSRLSELDTRLGALEQARIDFSQRSKDQAAISSFSTEIYSEELATVRQAADIVQRIPNEVSAAECTVVADYLERFDANDLSIRVDRICIDRANDAYSLNVALGQLAYTLFVTGDIAGGRKSYQDALKAYERFPSRDRSYVADVLGTTEVAWAGQELSAGNCKEAADHINAALNYSDQIVIYQDLKDALIRDVNAQKAEIDKCSVG